MQVTEISCYRQCTGCIGCKKFMEGLASLDPALAHVSMVVLALERSHAFPLQSCSVMIGLGNSGPSGLHTITCAFMSPLLVSTSITLPPNTGT
jgi:hypothetical protein